jgi:2-phosphosulfolactate phosphatase
MVVQVDLEFLAKDAHKAAERGNLITVIDVLRFSTTIVNALDNGVKSIIPTKSLKEAYKLHRQYPDYLLVGERKGRKPRGFDFGNSPLELTSKEIYGKNMIITTTSGTAALTRCRDAEWVLIGAFLNSKVIADKALEIAETKRVNVSLVLAGEKGRFSLEDFICAGAIAASFLKSKVSFADKTLAAVLAFEQIRNNLCGSIMETQHAKHLIKLGFKRDVGLACQLNVSKITPAYKAGKIEHLVLSA